MSFWLICFPFIQEQTIIYIENLWDCSCAFQEKDLEDKLNVIIFSDHGMTDISWMDKVIEVDAYINMSSIIKMMDRGPVVSLWPKPEMLEEVSIL